MTTLSLARNLMSPLLLIAAMTGFADITRGATAATQPLDDRAALLLAYERAADAGRFDEALGHAVTGCERLRLVYLCRELADLPLQMAHQGITVPPQYGAALRRVADKVCLAGKALVNADGGDITGFVCAYYGQQFGGTHTPPRQSAFGVRARHYLDSIHDAAFAGRLFEVACKRTSLPMCAASVAALRTSSTAATPTDLTTTHDRDDYEMALFRDDAKPSALCEYGTTNRRYHSPAIACRAAYETAMTSRAYTQATRYATLGCDAYRDRHLCQALPKIPFPAAQGRTTDR